MHLFEYDRYEEACQDIGTTSDARKEIQFRCICAEEVSLVIYNSMGEVRNAYIIFVEKI
jgi:hypothetical protein